MSDKEFGLWVTNLCRQVLAENPELIIKKVRESQDLDFTVAPMEVSVSSEMGIDDDALCWL